MEGDLTLRRGEKRKKEGSSCRKEEEAKACCGGMWEGPDQPPIVVSLEQPCVSLTQSSLQYVSFPSHVCHPQHQHFTITFGCTFPFLLLTFTFAC